MAIILATGYTYNIHFEHGNVDWDHIFIQPSYKSEPTDKPLIIRFNHTEIREVYDIL